MNNTNENKSTGGSRAQNLSSPIELSQENILDFQAAFSIMDTQSKGFVGADYVTRVAKAAGSFNETKKKLY